MTVTNFAQRALQSIIKRASTTDPFNSQEDSLYQGNLIGGNDVLENNSIDGSSTE